MNAIGELFAGFAERMIGPPGRELYVRTGGAGPPLLLLHGYPQVHVCWHKLAPELARHATLVMADLPGYGLSGAPAGDGAHETYSKRAMAKQCVSMMRALGHSRFIVAGHDRGGRVAYRLALDHPQVVSALILLDIIPTAEVWRRADAAWALAAYHWGFLAQPFPLPETMIGHDPVMYVEHTLKSWAKTRDLSPFSREALAHYRRLLQAPERVHAVCEDYRAGASIDRRLDEADIGAGRRITCPTLVLWGSDYLKSDPLPIWQSWCSSVSGAAVEGGHFLAEENPHGTLTALIPFLTSLGSSP